MKSIFFGKKRGQMFILATMLIAVYIIAMAMALMNIGSERYKDDHESIREPYLDSKREIQHYLELILSKYSENGSLMTRNIAISMIEEFLTKIEFITANRGITSDFQFHDKEFSIQAKQAPFSNITSGNTYISQIYGEFSLSMKPISSSITIDESFNISFKSYIEIQDNKVIIQGSRSNEFSYWEAASIYVLNETNKIIPVSDPDHTGIYIFTSVPNLDNLGILSVTLINGVHIFS